MIFCAHALTSKTSQIYLSGVSRIHTSNNKTTCLISKLQRSQVVNQLVKQREKRTIHILMTIQVTNDNDNAVNNNGAAASVTITSAHNLRNPLLLTTTTTMSSLSMP